VLRKRRNVMIVCGAQVILSVAVTIVGLARRGRALLVMQPFFIAAAVLGFYGARTSTSWMVSSHFLGSAGLSFVLGFFIIAESFIKRSGTDLFFFAMNMPMDLWMIGSSFFSFDLFRSLVKLKRELRQRHEQAAINSGQIELALTAPNVADLGRTLQRVAAADAAERRNVTAGPREAAGTAHDSLLRDLRCPISLEIMRDPVIAADGFSYERAGIERWLSNHRTSPITGRVLAHTNLTPNHSLRHTIEDLGASMGRSMAAAERTVH